MIFIAKNADFSANKIGQVALDYLQKTKDVLATYNNNSLTVNQQNKVNSLIKGLTDNNILSKISHLYLPILAPSLDKTLINVAKTSLPVEVVPNASAYSLDTVNGGMYQEVTGTPLNFSLDAAENLSDKNFHYLAFNTNIVESNLAYPVLINSPTASNIYMNFSGNVSQYMAGNTKIAGTNIQLLMPDSTLAALHKEQSLKGMSTTSLTGLRILNRSIVEEFTYTTPITSETLVGSQTLSLSGYNSGTFLGSHGLISLGRGLTSTELEIYNSLANDLMIAMGVSVYGI